MWDRDIIAGTVDRSWSRHGDMQWQSMPVFTGCTSVSIPRLQSGRAWRDASSIWRRCWLRVWHDVLLTHCCLLVSCVPNLVFVQWSVYCQFSVILLGCLYTLKCLICLEGGTLMYFHILVSASNDIPVIPRCGQCLNNHFQSHSAPSLFISSRQSYSRNENSRTMHYG